MGGFLDILKYIWQGRGQQDQPIVPNPLANVAPWLTPGYNGQPNPAEDIVRRQGGLSQMAMQQAMNQMPMGGTQGGGGLRGLLQNPNFLQGMAQIALAQGRYGGPRAQGFSNQIYQNQQMEQQRMAQEQQNAQNWARIYGEGEERRIRSEKQQADEAERQSINSMAKLSEVLKTAQEYGLTIEEAAETYGVKLQPETIARLNKALETQRKAQAEAEAKKVEEKFYVTPNGRLIRAGMINNIPAQAQATLEGPFKQDDAIRRANEITNPQAKLVPGRDIVKPKEVEEQEIRIARAKEGPAKSDEKETQAKQTVARQSRAMKIILGTPNVTDYNSAVRMLRAKVKEGYIAAEDSIQLEKMLKAIFSVQNQLTDVFNTGTQNAPIE